MLIRSQHYSFGDSCDLRVLLIAEAANPEWPSVPLEGWSHSRAIGQLTNAHIVTQNRNRPAFIRAGVPAAMYTSIDSERIAGPAYRLANALGGRNGKGWTIRTALSSITYAYFERLVWRRFSGRIRAGKYDIVHRLTPLSPTVPSRLATLCKRHGVPFILGPLNGGVPWPRGFDATRRQEREWLSYIRNAHRMVPGYCATRRDAAAIIIGSVDTWKQMPKRYRQKCVYIPENGLNNDHSRAPRQLDPTRPLRVMFLGRLVPYKGADLLLESALQLLRARLIHLQILGDGPQMPRLRQLIHSQGVQHAVTLGGWVDHAQAQQMLADAHVFAFPSIREFGGAVVLEAMAAGAVPIVVNYGGPSELVTDRTGFRIAMGTRVQLIERFADRLAQVVRRPEQLLTMSAAAQQRAKQQFSWLNKASQCVQVYQWALGERSTKPDFGMPLPDLHELPRATRPIASGVKI